MPRPWTKPIFKSGKRGLTSRDSATHLGRWIAIELLRGGRLTVSAAAILLAKNPDRVPGPVVKPGTARAMRHSHGVVEKWLAAEGIHPHKFRKLVAGK